MLDELRVLARTFPDDAAVRERLAGGLLNTLNDAKAEDDLARRDGLLDELRTLSGAFPVDAAAVRGTDQGPDQHAELRQGGGRPRPPRRPARRIARADPRLSR